MNTDSLSRRLRFAPPNPQVARIVLQQADLDLFAAIHRHGPLPSSYLFEFSKPLRRNKARFLNRLTELYNGDADGPYLTRPPQQFAGYKARYQHVVYDLAPRARSILSEAGHPEPSRSRTDPFLHQLMQACVGASFELAAPAYGLKYIHRDAVLDGRPLVLELGGGAKLIPDDLFAIEGEDEKGPWRRWCAVEIDRNTESIERKNLDYNTFGKKVGNYLKALRGRLFTDWGARNLTVLTVTTTEGHARNMAAYVKKQGDAKFESRFAFAVAPQFGVMWEVPGTVLSRLLSEPWDTPAGPKDLTRP